jgi:hypothetical protein
MPVKPPVEPTIESMDGEFKVVTATMRGIRYVLRELPADEYEKCLKLAQDPQTKELDNSAMLRFMLDKGALVEPKLTTTELWKKPYPVIRKLNDIVDLLHFTPLETEEEEQEDGKGEARG